MSLDKPKLGKNRFAEWKDDGDFDRRHSAECNGCHGDFNGTERYICLNCNKCILIFGRYHYYCQNYIDHMMENDEEGKKIQDIEERLYGF